MRWLVFVSFVVVFALPFGWFLTASFAEQWRYPALVPVAWTLQHWEVLRQSDWMERAVRTFFLALPVAAGATAAGFWSAHALRRLPQGEKWLLWAYLPYSFSPVVYAHVLKFLFNSMELSGHLAGVMLAQFILCYPFAVLFFFNWFDHQVSDMEALSRTLGASPQVVWLRVLLPLARSALITCFFQMFLISWFDYGLCSVIGLGQVRTLTTAVYQYIAEANAGLAAVSACLLCLPPWILLLFNQSVVTQKR